MMACPICLSDTPVAPRMTPCGHVACLPCFIRYFASEDVATGLRGASLKFRKCPICWDSIQLSEIKPVRWYSIDDGTDEENIVVASEPREGFDVAMRLFMRKPGTTLALPRDYYIPLSQVAVIPEGDVPWHYVPEVLHYAWIVKGTQSYMYAETKREIEELEKMEKEDETAFGDDGFWTQKAIQRIHDIAETYDSIGEGPSRQANLTLSTTIRKTETVESTPEDTPYQLLQSPSSRPRDAPYLFYQPRSASHYYLSPLDIRILKRAFGEYENFPSAILARVEHITSPQTVDDDFRRRVKYLGHLPSGSQVSFLECDWSEMIDLRVLETFTSEIEKRRRIRREKLVKEEKEREMEERVRRFGGRRAMGSFASYPEEDAFVGSTGQDSEDVKWVIANALASVPSGASPDILSTSPGISQLSIPADTSIARTVWGTPRVASSTATPVSSATPVPSTPKEVAGDDSDEPGESGGMWIQNWEEMLKADKTDASKNQNSRRKKGKKLVLMSNSVQRGI
jgi:RING-type zinc-finger